MVRVTRARAATTTMEGEASGNASVLYIFLIYHSFLILYIIQYIQYTLCYEFIGGGGGGRKQN